MKMMRSVCGIAAMLLRCTIPASADGVDLHGVDAPPMPVTTAAEVAPYLKPGTAAIRGRVIAKLGGVPVLYYRKVRVALIPAVPLEGWIVDNQVRIQMNEPSLGASPQIQPPLLDAVRFTTSGPTGEYSFLDVPALPYVVFAAVEEDESRSGTTYHTEFSMVPIYDPDGRQFFDEQAQQVPSTYSYTCHSRGWLYGFVTGVADTTTPASLAMMYGTNDGC